MTTENTEERPDGAAADGSAPIPHDEPDDAEDAADLLNIVETDAKGRKVVGLDKLIDQRKAVKGLRKEIAALKAQITDQTETQTRIDRVMPIAEAVEKNPRIAAMIKEALDGTRPTRPASEQPEHDEDAAAYAEIHNLVTKDKEGQDVWDVARARRALDIEARNTEKRIKPHLDAAQDAAFGLRGEQNLAALYHMTTPSGELIASEESIKEVMKESEMPLKMLANPRVARTVGLMAAGLDREKGRTPKAPIEPLYTERAGGRRGDTTQITDDDRRAARAVGLTDADLAGVGKRNVSRKGDIDIE